MRRLVPRGHHRALGQTDDGSGFFTTVLTDIENLPSNIETLAGPTPGGGATTQVNQDGSMTTTYVTATGGSSSFNSPAGTTPDQIQTQINTANAAQPTPWNPFSGLNLNIPSWVWWAAGGVVGLVLLTTVSNATSVFRRNPRGRVRYGKRSSYRARYGRRRS